MNYSQNNKQIIERKLMGCLDKICKALHIHIDEWDINEKLAEAISNEWNKISPENGDRLGKLVDNYDNLHKVAGALKTELEEKYFLFTNLNELTNIKDTYGNH